MDAPGQAEQQGLSRKLAVLRLPACQYPMLVCHHKLIVKLQSSERKSSQKQIHAAKSEWALKLQGIELQVCPADG